MLGQDYQWWLEPVLCGLGGAASVATIYQVFAPQRSRLSDCQTVLKVVPMLAFPDPLDLPCPFLYLDEDVERCLKTLYKCYATIHVVNRGEKPVTIHEVGFLSESGTRLPWRSPYWILDGKEFPITLAPGEETYVFEDVWPLRADSLHRIGYAKTDLNEEFSGTSPILDDLCDRFRKLHTWERPD